MKHYMRFLALLLAAVLLLTCAACGGGPVEDDPPTESGTIVQRDQIPPLTPVFLSPEIGLEALKPMIYGSIGWGIDAQGDYIFAYHHHYRYVLRYDVKANQIDKIIDLGEAPEYWYYGVTFSPDGQRCITQAHEFDGPGHTGKVLIDLANETVVPTEQEHFPHSTDGKPYKVERDVLPDGMMGWFFGVEGAEKTTEIKALRPYASMIVEVIAIDENRVGALLPVSGEASGYLGYYKFAVIDLARDKIVQECPMNVLEPGEEYPTYPNQPEEPELMLIDYHLMSVTVMRARFPTDGRSNYDGFDIVKVVDAPADVAGFEECLKQSAWKAVDASGWLKGNPDPGSPQSHGILYMLGENGQGLVAHLFSGLDQESLQGGAVALAMCDVMPTPPEKYRESIAPTDAFDRYWVSWDVYKILYGLVA